jgi:DNA-binding LacI/PurR family transcriptional regulator
MGNVTLQTIADRLGVSRMTVSNAFSRPDQLSADLRERVLAEADALGYCGPDPAAQSLSRGRSSTIGVLFTDRLAYAFSDVMATEFLAGVAEVVEGLELGVTVLSTPRAGNGAGAVAKAVVDGLIVYSVDADSPGLVAARRRQIPLVFADQRPEKGIPSVVAADRAGAAAAARHLVELGHTRIAIVSEAMAPDVRIVPARPRTFKHHVVRERMAGWLRGLGSIEPLVVSAPANSRELGADAFRLILASGPAPTAVLALTDVLALGVVSAAVEAGLRVPQDLSVVGFDDSPVASTADLTTVRQSQRAKGRLSAELLASALSGSTPASPTPLPTELVVRSSTAKPHPRRTR